MFSCEGDVGDWDVGGSGEMFASRESSSSSVISPKIIFNVYFFYS